MLPHLPDHSLQACTIFYVYVLSFWPRRGTSKGPNERCVCLAAPHYHQTTSSLRADQAYSLPLSIPIPNSPRQCCGGGSSRCPRGAQSLCLLLLEGQEPRVGDSSPQCPWVSSLLCPTYAVVTVPAARSSLCHPNQLSSGLMAINFLCAVGPQEPNDGILVSPRVSFVQLDLAALGLVP